MTAEPELTERQRNLIRHSFRRATHRYDLIASLTFDRLFNLSPSLRPYFPSDLRESSRKLMELLALAVQRIDQPEALDELLRTRIDRGETLRLLLAHESAWVEAFLWALRYGAPVGYGDEAEQAWACWCVQLVALARRATCSCG